jgi:Outer membrane protein beta-barrel domain
MSVKQLLIAALVAVTMLAASALAQKNELTGVIGKIFISDQGSKTTNFTNNNLTFGNGISLEVDYGRYLMGNPFLHLTAEVPVVIDWDQDLHFVANTVPSDYRAYFVTPALRANLFATTAVSPWISIGGGIGRFSPNSQLEFGGKNPNGGATTGVFQGGIGLDVKLWHSLDLRGEVRDFWSGTPNYGVVTGKTRQHNFNVGAGVVWHFGK